MTNTIDNYFSQFCHCVPIKSVIKEAYERLKTETSFTQYEEGENIFSIGDNDPNSLFLLEGEIELLSNDGKKSILSAKQEQSLFALSSLKPRLFNAHALDHVLIAKINTKILDKLLIWEQSATETEHAAVEVDDISFCFDASDMEWKMAMLQTQLFLTLPAANITFLFDCMEVMEVKKDQQIITIGEPGDYYYIIKSGDCIVTRSFEGNTDEIIINELEAGDCFGEEALVSGKPRNANVIMRTDGTLMRLSQETFHSMLEEPLLNWVEKDQVKKLIQEGAIPIDVRTEDEFKHSGIKNTLNIPLYLLRVQIKVMDKKEHYILFCDNGSRSSAAAFIMTQKGFKNVSILTGGLDS